jgi:hypothetical protein
MSVYAVMTERRSMHACCTTTYCTQVPVQNAGQPCTVTTSSHSRTCHNPETAIASCSTQQKVRCQPQQPPPPAYSFLCTLKT